MYSVQKLELFSQKVNKKIIHLFLTSCPIRQYSSSRDVPWWKRLSLKDYENSLVNFFYKAKQSSEWAQYKRALNGHNKEIKKIKKKLKENCNCMCAVARKAMLVSSVIEK